MLEAIKKLLGIGERELPEGKSAAEIEQEEREQRRLERAEALKKTLEDERRS